MKRTLLIAVLLFSAGLAVTLSLRRRATSPPFPCMVTAKAGWLTAVTSQAMLRLEWGEGTGRVGVSELGGTLSWEPRSEAAVRALALKVLEPISAPIRSNTADEVSLFAGCEGEGAPWRGESQDPGSYKDCLRPAGEGRIECLQRIFQAHGTPTDEAAGAVADRIHTVVSAGGVAIVEPTGPAPRPHRRPAHSTGWVDDLLERVLPSSDPSDVDSEF